MLIWAILKKKITEFFSTRQFLQWLRNWPTRPSKSYVWSWTKTQILFTWTLVMESSHILASPFWHKVTSTWSEWTSSPQQILAHNPSSVLASWDPLSPIFGTSLKIPWHSSQNTPTSSSPYWLSLLVLSYQSTCRHWFSPTPDLGRSHQETS